MGIFCGGHLRLAPNEVATWRRIARRLSATLGSPLNFAQAAIAYAMAIDAGALESVREEWRGNTLAAEVIEAVAAMLRGDTALLSDLADDESLSGFEVSPGESASIKTGRWRVSISEECVGVLE